MLSHIFCARSFIQTMAFSLFMLPIINKLDSKLQGHGLAIVNKRNNTNMKVGNTTTVRTVVSRVHQLDAN